MHDAADATQTLNCVLDPARAAALHVALDRPGDPPGAGDPLPHFWHQIYFWQALRPAALGPDGHPATGTGLIPDLGPKMRMWAGGRLRFHAPLRIGAPATCRTRIESTAEKTGRTGRLGFVTLRHDIAQAGTNCVTEYQDLVYRDPPDARKAVAPPRAPGPHGTDPGETDIRTRAIRFDTTLLFRYSALTFNGHRIHYDADYARKVEGYAGLVVHGPLLAQLLIHFAEDDLGPLSAFSFRGTSALIQGEDAALCRTGTRLWVRGADGRQCMQASAEPAT